MAEIVSRPFAREAAVMEMKRMMSVDLQISKIAENSVDGRYTRVSQALALIFVDLR